MRSKSGTHRSIGAALTAATCGLIGIHTDTALGKGKAGEWDIDTAVLFYSEADSRVQAVEPVVNATKNVDEERKWNIKVLADALTGASPNGATPSENVQTFTRPSGNGHYNVSPAEQPLDDTFHDTRGSVSTSWSAPIDRDYAYSVGVYGSKEYDYTSMGVNGSVSRYLNNKNTTLNVGLSSSIDLINPEGGIPVPFTAMVHRESLSEEDFVPAFAATRESSDDTKTLVDILLGVTQVINRQTLMQFNYSLSLSSGYMTDPFKVLSVIDDRAGDNYGGNLQDAHGDNLYLYEARPDSRMKHALFWQTKYMLGNGDVLDGSYRFMLDDWGINSHTLELKYRWNMGGSYLEPHVRYYMQSQADFYKRYLTATEYSNGSPMITEASADYRLGEMTSGTLGVKWGYALSSDQELSVRAEYMKQMSSGQSGFGKLASQELYPDTDAFWVQFSYNF